MGNNQPDSPFPFLESPDRDISAEASGSQLLFAGGRIWNSLKLQDAYYKQSELTIQAGERDIVRNVRNTFDAVLFRKAALDIDISRLAHRNDELQDAKDLRDVGMATSLDVRQAQLNLNVAKDRMKADEAALEEARIDFNLSIGRSGDDSLLTPEGKLRECPDTDALLKNLYAKLSNDALLDIHLLSRQAESSRISYDIACGERYPTLTAVASGKSNGENTGEMYESWNMGLQLSYPLFDGNLIRAKRAEARAGMEKASETLMKTKKSISGAVATIHLKLESLAERVEMQKEAVRLSRENYNDARGHYRAGTITLTRLGEFNLSYTEARFVLAGLYYARRQVIAEALALLGD